MAAASPEDYNPLTIVQDMKRWLQKPNFKFSHGFAYEPETELACIVVAQAPEPDLFKSKNYYYRHMLRLLWPQDDYDAAQGQEFRKTIGAANLAYLEALKPYEVLIDRIETHYEDCAMKVHEGAMTSERAVQILVGAIDNELIIFHAERAQQ